ncbi:MAG: antibiotic biosynthesis monooxygenase [Deltaproteobacteria bacterium]|nr:antibiotic biosynthesis monooxygenase [Deltaproteobacteria bacterium]
MPSSKTLRVVALFKAKPEQVEALKNFLAKLMPPTRQERGCLRYELHQNNADPTDFAFIEEWENDTSLDAHLKSPHVEAALPLVGEYLAAPVDIRRYGLV